MRARTAGALGVVGTAAVWSVPAIAPISPLVGQALGIRMRLDSRRGVALTFDDGPHKEGTPAVLAVLERLGATATFFLVGEQVQRFPSLASEIAAAGHEIALHGFHHSLLLRRSPRALERDLERARAVIEDATGRSLRCYRPPYGVFSFASLELVRRRGWEPVLWSRWGRDWRAGANPATIARRATADLSGGDVVLLHDADHYSSGDSWRRTAAALPDVLAAASETGEELVSVSQSR
jgi:peptidoglycan-N-acetylglucosamine deacetylase